MRFSVLVATFIALVPATLLSGSQPDAWLGASTEPIDLRGGSRVEFATMDSKAIGGPGAYSIFLPPSYESGGASYPVVYFLHGLFNDHTSWTIDRHGDIPALLDQLMSSQELEELVLVFPDGGGSKRRSFRTDPF